MVDSLENKNRVSGTKINDLTTTVETAMLYAKAQDTFFDLQRFGLATTTRYGATNQMELLTNLVNAVTLTNDTRLKSMIDDLNSSRQKANDASIGFMLYTPSKIVDILSQPGQLSSSTN